MRELLDTIKSNPALRHELIVQMQMDDEAGAKKRFFSTLIGVCMALNIKPQHSPLQELTEKSVGFRKEAPLKTSWDGGPQDPNPYKQQLKALHHDPQFMGMCQYLAQQGESRN